MKCIVTQYLTGVCSASKLYKCQFYDNLASSEIEFDLKSFKLACVLWLTAAMKATHLAFSKQHETKKA